MKPSTKKPSVRTIGNSADSTKTKELRRGGTPRPVDEKIAQLATRLDALEKRVEHDFGGSDSAHLGARVEELEEKVDLLGLKDRMDQYASRIASLEAEHEKA